MKWFRFTQQYGRQQRARAERRMTKTGETFGERAAYHRRGELSPGEHELARMIREALKSQESEP